ncbi:MAG: zinc ribbon domain-containing protein [Bacillota bacterium]|nr:zinc ribbon domain-containing protein [Bacillota bacterium]MDP4158496.1 zinc ribbon domain-containing protein [Bacillota bacterium]
MPMYEFGCPNCGVLTTELCRMGENGEMMTCLECGHEGLLKHISGFSSLGASGGSGGRSCLPGCRGNCTGCH